MIAPHSLALTGALAAELGQWSGIWFVLIGGLFVISAAALSRWIRSRGKTVAPARPLGGAARQRSLAVLVLAGRLISALMGIAILAVGAGFLFNEIFVYWFPNFAFAYLALATVASIQLLGSGAAEKAQVVFTGMAATGLSLLVVIGLVQEPSVINGPTVAALPDGWHGPATALLLVVGFDLVYLSPSLHRSEHGRALRWMVFGIVSGVVLLGLWSIVGIRHVAAERLNATTVPHILTATQAAGPTGLKIMGVTAIAGAMAGINALLRAVTLTVVEIWIHADHRSGLPPVDQTTGSTFRTSAWTVGLTLVIGLMLAAGMAGTDAVDIYFRAGLIFWLIHYAALQIADLRTIRHSKAATRTPSHKAKMIVSWAGVLLFVLFITVLVVTDPDRWMLIRFMGLAYAVLWGLVASRPKLERLFSNARMFIEKRPPFNNNSQNQRRAQ